MEERKQRDVRERKGKRKGKRKRKRKGEKAGECVKCSGLALQGERRGKLKCCASPEPRRTGKHSPASSCLCPDADLTCLPFPFLLLDLYPSSSSSSLYSSIPSSFNHYYLATPDLASSCHCTFTCHSHESVVSHAFHTTSTHTCYSLVAHMYYCTNFILPHEVS